MSEKVSDLAREYARKNKIDALGMCQLGASKMSASRDGVGLVFKPTDETANAVYGDRFDPAVLAVELADRLVVGNRRVMMEMGKVAAQSLNDFAQEIDTAEERCSESLQRFHGKLESVITETRTKRMAIAAEVREVLVSLKDVQSFLRGMDKDLAVMREVVELGKALQSAFGADSLRRLAEALLVAAVGAEEKNP